MRTRFFLFIPVDNDGDGEIDEVDEYEVVYNTGDRDSNDSETIVDADGNIVKSLVQVSPTDPNSNGDIWREYDPTANIDDSYLEIDGRDIEDISKVISTTDTYMEELIGDGIDNAGYFLQATKPRIVSMHNLAYKHDTHVATTLRAFSALHHLPEDEQPATVYGMEVWCVRIGTTNRLIRYHM